MDRSKEQAKAAKKAAKAEVKSDKAAAKAAALSPSALPAADGSASPAERSARAAERQVVLQRFRVLFALLMFAVAVATLLWTVKPWQGSEQPRQPSGSPAPTETVIP